MPVKSKNKPLKKKRNKLKSIRRKKRGGMIVNSPPSSPSSIQEISENEDMNIGELLETPGTPEMTNSNNNIINESIINYCENGHKYLNLYPKSFFQDGIYLRHIINLMAFLSKSTKETYDVPLTCLGHISKKTVTGSMENIPCIESIQVPLETFQEDGKLLSPILLSKYKSCGNHEMRELNMTSNMKILENVNYEKDHKMKRILSVLRKGEYWEKDVIIQISNEVSKLVDLFLPFHNSEYYKKCLELQNFEERLSIYLNYLATELGGGRGVELYQCQKCGYIESYPNKEDSESLNKLLKQRECKDCKYRYLKDNYNTCEKCGKIKKRIRQKLPSANQLKNSCKQQ